MGIFKSLFSSSKEENPEEEKAKTDQKNFDILKYDGIRAQKMGRLAYAIKCFTEALNIQEDFETMTYLANAYIVANEQENALHILDRMVEIEPDHVNTLLTRVHVLFFLDKDAEEIEVCQHIIELDPENHLPYYLMSKAKKATGDLLGGIADLTKTITIKEDFSEAYLLRAEILISMKQAKEALPDVEKVIELVPEEETAFLLKGKIHEALGDMDDATANYQHVLDLNPFNEDAALLAGKLLITQEKLDEAITFFDEAIETNPAFAKAYAERGRAKNLKGDKDGAFEDLKKSIELNPEGEEAQKMNGQHTNFDNMYKGGIF
ncbi:tetratricopeptide repeat protein [Parabacteroides bouchesdurhonensis]|uniref:tetratricopeptide repeat protein n=1 Tax=Parabacteroides bouchesdurhonensis TaxID=1936995 RepID=UPI0022E1C0D0|nr:tetratricopeptide repeat protein [Parabacteroides bouchesdurhonensis]